MICPWFVHDLSMICPWFVHGLSMVCPWFCLCFVHDLSMICPWLCSWFVRGFVDDLSMVGPWLVHGWCIVYPHSLMARLGAHSRVLCGMRPPYWHPEKFTISKAVFPSHFTGNSSRSSIDRIGLSNATHPLEWMELHHGQVVWKLNWAQHVERPHLGQIWTPFVKAVRAHPERLVCRPPWPPRLSKKPWCFPSQHASSCMGLSEPPGRSSSKQNHLFEFQLGIHSWKCSNLDCTDWGWLGNAIQKKDVDKIWSW